MYLIFGKGRSGLAASRLLQSKGIPHFLADDKTPNWEELLKKVHTVVVSPGIKPTHRVFKLSKDLKRELIGETELAYRFWRGDIVAITGTDGKTTTTRLTYLILKNSLSGVYEGGNIGVPFSEIVSKTESGIAVLEVSSFQGYTLKTFRPNVGAFISFSEDHLDWHTDIRDYLEGKYRIFRNQRREDFLLLNGSVEEIRKTPSKAKKLFFLSEDADIRLSNGWVVFKSEKLFEVSKLKLRGIHNVWNASVSAVIGRIFGVSISAIREVLYSFEGLPHRLQYLGRFRGVEVYNDSKSTTPHSLSAALNSFDKKVVLLFGGKDKGADFSPLAPLFGEKVKLAVAYGENRFKLKRQLGGSAPILLEETLEGALKRVIPLLEEGDILLLSPGSASFDQFQSYEERGEVFMSLVRELME